MFYIILQGKHQTLEADNSCFHQVSSVNQNESRQPRMPCFFSESSTNWVSVDKCTKLPWQLIFSSHARTKNHLNQKKENHTDWMQQFLPMLLAPSPLQIQMEPETIETANRNSSSSLSNFLCLNDRKSKASPPLIYNLFVNQTPLVNQIPTSQTKNTLHGTFYKQSHLIKTVRSKDTTETHQNYLTSSFKISRHKVI